MGPAQDLVRRARPMGELTNKIHKQKMKFPTSLKLAGATAAALVVSSSLMAEVELTKEFSLSGYVVGSASYNKIQGSSSDSNLDLDAYKLQGVGKFDKVSITGSVFAYGTGSGDGFGSSPIVLDAYGTYDFGGGSTVSVGKFLSWLGYEAFDSINMLQISYANPGSTGFIPAYHTGVKVEKSTDAFAVGVAVLDSVYGPTYYKGDGDLDNGVGLETYFTYKAIKDFTLFAGLAYDTGDAAKTKAFTADLWAQYVLGKTTFAGEFCYGSKKYKDTGLEGAPIGTADGYFWLALVKQAFDDKWSLTGRISGGEGVDKDRFTRFTIAPTYAVTKNLDVLAEYTYTDLSHAAADYAQYAGIQVRFKF